jgi:hypothetical protein
MADRSERGTAERPGDRDRIERHVSGGLLEAREVLGPSQFREWAQRATQATTSGYDSVLRSGVTNPLESVWRNQPWVTPVVGSGPIGFPQDFAAKAAWLPELVLREMEAGDGTALRGDLDALVVSGADPKRFVPAFVNGLVTRRYGSPIDALSRDSEPPDLTIDQSVVWVVVAAAQLTRTFHRMSLDSSRPISRWGSEKAEVPHDDPRAADLAEEYLPLLELACSKASEALQRRAARLKAGDEPSTNPQQAAAALLAIRELIVAIHDKVRARDTQIMLVHLEQLTDLSWYLLAQVVLDDIDPGWTSLLLQLVLTQPNVVATGLFRPRWKELEAVANGVRDVYSRAASSASARRRGPELKTEVTTFYNSVADVMWAQSAAVTWASTRQREPAAGEPGEIDWVLPRPVTWVCSFDYEVELALWRTAASTGRSAQFAVVMPVYVRQTDRPSHGTMVWLEATIDVPRGADALSDEEFFRRATTVSSWRLLSNTTDEAGAGDETQHRPVVVHLLGCPLLDLPDIAPPSPGANKVAGQNLLRGALIDAGALIVSKRLDAAAQPAPSAPRRSDLVHAVTVDEVLAVRQTARDWSDSSDNVNSPSLPLDLFRAAGPAARVYAVLGVPLRDPAVRLRVTAVLSRGALIRNHGDDAGLGLFVNKRIDDEELTVMSALGLEVYRTRCEEFGQSLGGYAHWLQEHCTQIDHWRGASGELTVSNDEQELPPFHQPDAGPDDRPALAVNEADPRQTRRAWKELS